MYTAAQIFTITVIASTIMMAAVFGGLYHWTTNKLRNHLEELDRRYERTE